MADMKLMTYVMLEAGTAPSVSGLPRNSLTKLNNWYEITSRVVGQTWKLDLLSTLKKPDGTTATIVDSRRGTAKSASVSGNVLRVQFTDVDTPSLNSLYPIKTFEVADFPELFSNHVGRPVPDGVGQLIKVPLTWIKKSTGDWRYSSCEARSGMVYTVQTVYRSTSEGQVGGIVSATEYTIGTTTAAVATDTKVVHVAFAREQLTKDGSPYYFMADVLVTAGTDARLAPTEIQRLLILAGVPVNTASFATAKTFSTTELMYIDAGYVKQRTIKAILEDLLFACRGVLSKNGAGEWVLVQDKARAVDASYRSMGDLLSVDGVEYRDKPQRVDLFYGVKQSGTEDWNTTPVSRVTAGTLPAKRYQNPYIRDWALADRLVDYLSKRDSTQRRSTVTIHAVQHETREVITINDVVAWTGDKTWLIESVRRPADKNVLSLREYIASVYTYTAAPAPAGASSGYTPDYSLTAPTAPTALTYVGGSSGTTIAADGVGRAYMFFTCTPPADGNFVKIIFTAQDAGGGYVRVESKKNGAVYEAVLAGLRPGVSHTVNAYAVNAGGLDGALVTTTQAAPGYATTPGNVGSGAFSAYQTGTQTARFEFTPSTSPNVAFYEAKFSNDNITYGPNLKFGGPTVEGTFSTAAVASGSGFVDVRTVDTFGNVSAWRSPTAVSLTKWVSDSIIAANSVTNASIATSTLTQNRLKTTTGSVSNSLAAAASANVELDTYCFSPSISAPSGADVVVKAFAGTISGATDRARFRLTNNGGSTVTVVADYRYIQT